MHILTPLLGGVGLFLLGMLLLTDGLRAAAGEALRDLLARFTGGTVSSFLSGVGLTVLVQSSSATIVATIGFVSAGLLTFGQSVGVIVGAAVGTTSTGWLVALLGLRVSVSGLAYPLIAAGATLRLFGRGRYSAIGLALAGFGLIFVAIATLQTGMEGLAATTDLSVLATDRVGARALLVVIGMGMTVVMQSSSAAVATTLAALQTGAIPLDQAALLVIGQNVGTSATAALASIGAAVPARRTALAQIVFNTFSGVLAFVLLPFLLPAFAWLAERGEAAISIAAFHTAFNLLGAGVLLPLLPRYSRFIVRLVPDRRPSMTRHLDDSLRSITPVAVEAARRSVLEIASTLFRASRRVLASPDGRPGTGALLEASAGASSNVRTFLAALAKEPSESAVFHRHLALLHALDHLDRLRVGLQEPPAPAALQAEAMTGPARLLDSPLQRAIEWFSGAGVEPPVEGMREVSERIAALRREGRPAIMEETAAGRMDPDEALRLLDATRWIDRVAYHQWRALHHLALSGALAGATAGVEMAEARASDLNDPDRSIAAPTSPNPGAASALPHAGRDSPDASGGATT